MLRVLGTNPLGKDEKAIFEQIDTDHDGKVSFSELAGLFPNPNPNPNPTLPLTVTLTHTLPLTLPLPLTLTLPLTRASAALAAPPRPRRRQGCARGGRPRPPTRRAIVLNGPPW